MSDRIFYQDWIFELMAQNIWRIRLKEKVLWALGKTSEALSELEIPFAFRLSKISLYHNSGDAMDIIIQRQPSGWALSESIILAKETDRTEQSFLFTFGEKYEYERSKMRIRIWTTSGDAITPEIYVQKLGE